MKVLITHFYTRDNRGDAAILQSLLQELNRVLKSPKISISTMENLNKYKNFDGVETLNSIISWCRLNNPSFVLQVLRTAYIIFVTFIWGSIFCLFNMDWSWLIPRGLRELTQKLIKADIVLLVGGGYLRANKSIDDDLNLIQLLYTILLAKIAGKPVGLHSMSIGPFATTFQKVITGFVLRQVDFILLRESISAEIVRSFGVSESKYMLTSDGAFLFTDNPKQSLPFKLPSPKNNEITVGITVRKWLAPIQQEKYEKEMAKFIDFLLKDVKAHVVFIPQGTNDQFDDDDRKIAHKVKTLMSEKDNSKLMLIDDNLTHRQVKYIYSKMNYLVGTRFHSVIFSLTSNVPCIAVEYEHKTRGIMQDLDLEHWIIKMDEVTSQKLVKLFKDLLKSRKSYLEQVKKVLPGYQKQGRAAIERLVAIK